MKNIQYFTLFRLQELNSREYLIAYQGNLLSLESVLLIQKHKSLKFTCRSISSEYVHQIYLKNNGEEKTMYL